MGGLPMGRPSHGKAFPWEGLLIGKVSQGQGFYSSHGLVLIPCVVPHDLGGVSSGFSLERFVIGKASHGKAFPWEAFPMTNLSNEKPEETPPRSWGTTHGMRTSPCDE